MKSGDGSVEVIYLEAASVPEPLHTSGKFSEDVAGVRIYHIFNLANGGAAKELSSSYEYARRI